MKLSSTTSIKAILATHGVSPSKGLGQNFLVDAHAIQKLLSAAQVRKEDVMLEIGPGVGVLTQELARRAKKVIAVEKDAKMVSILKETLAEFENIEITHGDILKTNFQFSSLNFQYKIVSNLPYYITAPTIRKFLEAENQPESLTLIVQKEVGQRICAHPPDMSILAVSVQFYAAAKLAGTVKKSAFWPQPRVDSAIIHIVPSKEKPAVEQEKFFSVVKAGFLHPRRQLLGNLSIGLQLPKSQIEAVLRKNNIDPTRRAETLSIQDWISLAKELL